MPTVTITFVQAIYVLATFVHISGGKLDLAVLGPNLMGALIFLDKPKNIFGPKKCLVQKKFWPKTKFWSKIFWDQT